MQGVFRSLLPQKPEQVPLWSLLGEEMPAPAHLRHCSIALVMIRIHNTSSWSSQGYK